ncbi:hypothetical protein HUB98_11265 [Paenibacillus barcinonensis]|uniref:Uncharacterized protein n=1 Tax=Paenibacillus barcinonensis TaxID=198119 RepID=A0A2V4V8T5_PAEBA|nr:hypothetical protein [Paenibacillus barcinonensis]PYE48311.1 hypothetical protein DFQ00_109165 [Paenibacillus barcinonensis]QKS56850.1 hypothetical protein HUB98_11265 [Paenibacillus barcinonensis]
MKPHSVLIDGLFGVAFLRGAGGLKCTFTMSQMPATLDLNLHILEEMQQFTAEICAGRGGSDGTEGINRDSFL